MDIEGKEVKPLTRGPSRSMNVEPAVSADGKSIASLRIALGDPMIFTMMLTTG